MTVTPLAESLSQSEPYPVIGINGKDPTDRKVFTLLHEVVHLTLRQSAITDAADGAADDDHEVIEIFCNAVAAEVLMPSRQSLALMW